MSQKICCFVFILIFTGYIPGIHSQQTSFEANFNTEFQKLTEFHTQIKQLHPILAHLYPVVIVEKQHFYVFDFDSLKQKYQFIKKVPTTFPLPEKIRAAFNLAEYDNQTVCVVTKDVFDSMDGYVTIFHEFVHCYQGATCEQKIKGQLSVAREAMRRQDYMWELNHPFPYTDSIFTKWYEKLLQINPADENEIISIRNTLKGHLKKEDYEYLCWQEWKEGLARLIENKIQAELQLPINQYGTKKPFHRVTLYAGGAKLIQFLSNQYPTESSDLESFFNCIYDFGE
ncbi:hypothetical protein JW964_14400 [candidate division KSB1 bacterium]|nr:hypothetical protein [candidate division KSB1 bacterium]